jgi:hypothetical protein
MNILVALVVYLGIGLLNNLPANQACLDQDDATYNSCMDQNKGK